MNVTLYDFKYVYFVSVSVRKKWLQYLLSKWFKHKVLNEYFKNGMVLQAYIEDFLETQVE